MQREKLKTTKIRKQVICNRISEPSKPSSKPPTVINHNRHSDGPNFSATHQPQMTKNSDDTINKLRQLTANSKQMDKKYNKPELHTALVIAKKLEDLKLASAKRIENMDDLTPRTKTQVTKQISQKLNFPNNKTIYKQLIPINVNDSVLEVKPSRRSKKFNEKHKSVPKDPEPQLSSYLTVIEPQKNKYKLNLDDVEQENRQSFDLNSNFRDLLEFYQQNLCSRKSLSTSICSVIAE